MQLTFCGAAGEVTGSCFLVDTGNVRFLVDCGMFQGGRDADLKNQSFPAFDPTTIDFVLLTHAHIDHSGLLPRLSMKGFKGSVYTTQATIELLDVMLRDSAHIQVKEAEWAEQHPHRHAHTLMQPLYQLADVDDVLQLVQAVTYNTDVHPHPEVKCRFVDAGHILGSAVIEVWAGGKKIVFSGDLGQPQRLILRDPTPVQDADVLLVESTYGNRLHKNLDDTLDEFVTAIEKTLHRGGNIIMPAFTVGRAQEILYLLFKLTRQRRLHNLKVYVDSPMALAATEITLRHIELFNQEAKDMLAWAQERRKDMPDIRFVQDANESIALNDIKHGAIIISASGMCDAGRIKHHLRHNLSRSECSVIITGFQAMGTLGRRLVDGVTRATIFGREIPVRASIYTIGGLSAHADQAGLLHWLGQFKQAPKHTYIVHGESSTAQQFSEVVQEQLRWNATVAVANETVSI
ncbi:MAG: MBL fold metallo-hydrolase [Methylophilales bacterium]|nr:MBL fold metallo-hydrolase [Methylophilales bacterium]